MVNKYFNVLLILSIIIFGCSKAKIKDSKSTLNNPEYHTNLGENYFKKNELSKAFECYDKALQLDPEYSPALVGTAIIYGIQGNHKAGFKLLKQAKNIEKHIGLIRLHNMERGKDWYEAVQEEFKKAIKISSNNSSLWYYMGDVYEANYEFDKAGEAFKKVIEINNDFLNESKIELNLVLKIQRSDPKTIIGKKIALKKEITRAEVSALFINELNLDKTLDEKAKKNINKGPEPNEFSKEINNKIMKIKDINNNEFKKFIETIANLKIRGLEVFPNQTFQPDKKITRVEYAVMIEDILMKITGDESLTTKFICEKSPYNDIKNDHFAFNAIMTIISRGLMEAKSVDEFGMQEEINGADALLTIKKLIDELKL
ncbi:tetratricopeptide repeat protein [Candidatus Poribacteria bacterium]|nr:tetratricopeptide repeat protein [Candidatus Poribacteria bacterium]